MRNILPLTQELLTNTLDYNEDTGVFTWVNPIPNSNRYVGDIANSLTATGYIKIGLYGKVYLAHRLAFLYMLGAMPVGQVDHVDGDKLNNAWNNLRDVTTLQNGCNKKVYASNKTGARGVHWNNTRKHYVGQVQYNYKKYHVGCFDSVIDAEEAVNAYRYKLQGEYARK